MQSTADPRLTEAVRENLVRADQFSEESPVYDFLTGSGLTKSCEDDVVSELVELHRRQARGWRLKIAAPRSSALKSWADNISTQQTLCDPGDLH